MENSRGARDDSVRSVDRAVTILQVLARLGQAGVTEVATEIDVHKATVSRLLATLESRGLVEQSASRGRYRLGYGVVQLAAGATQQHDLSVLSRPICSELADVVGETVTVAVREGHAVVSIDQVMGSSTVTTVDWVGRRTPMHATSAGKVFLAHLGPGERGTLLASGLERYTEHTIVDPDVLERELAAVRRTGYAATLEEHELGLAAMAAPIRSLDGQVIAALAISGPTYRINAQTTPGLAVHLISAAAEVSVRAGYPKPG